MKIAIQDFTYEELLQKVKEQELLIQELKEEKYSITNFEYFVNESPDLVCIADNNAYFKVVNDAFVNILGYSRNELLSRPFLEFIYPDDLEKTFKEIKLLSLKNPTIDFENRYIKKNGQLVFLEWRANLNISNNLIYAIARDVTDMRKTQEKLLSSEKSLNEAQKIAKIGSWDFNLTTQELNWSNELYKIFEIEKKDFEPNLYGKYLSRFLEDDIEVLNKNIYNTITNKIPYEMEHGIVLDNNKKKWVFCTGIPILDNQNNVVALKGVVQNITQKKLIDDTIKAKEKAEAASIAKSEFLSNMSHEIRTPLNGIVGFTDLLLKTKLDKDQLQYLKTVNESANTLMDIINNILDFSKIEAGKMELNFEEIDIFELSSQVINLFKYEANHKKIDLILRIDTNVPQYILGDSFRLKQILVNLLSNAMKFTATGHIKLILSQEEEFDAISKIKFSVIDTGIGIKIQNQNKIFQSFVQADNTTTRRYGGTGLGLAISNQLLALKKSELKLISSYGVGSEFFFAILFKKINKKEGNMINEELKPITEKENIPFNSLSSYKILIAEDNKINMLLAKTLIKKMLGNCVLIEVTNGFDAVLKVKEEMPDLVLMDIQMPIQNGYDATSEIRKLSAFKYLPIIALTAGVLNGEKEKCMEYGMSDYLTKPIIFNELEKILMKWLKN
ncbi:histidine kinase dimerization/phospho-acceptor domain-containing protein [Flavobacterium sp. IMCC34518]|uniref:histidine kinase dimerization/phospho-acceptor domain-containing protein n=1 Tax=Flavobacterium sp. IMCC34518 TaxID=3003623 RepID=UPI0024821F56|nr:histidine kinase dimerization/phospho-acceptor domain-containing protein [Flavobacterium sp. IMCC34518]